MTESELDKLATFRQTLLTERVTLLLHQALKAVGRNNSRWSADAYAYIVEELYAEEVEPIESFLKWMEKHDMTFGSANYKRIVNIFIEHIHAMDDLEGFLK